MFRTAVFRHVVRARRAWRETQQSFVAGDADNSQGGDLLTFVPSLMQFGALTAFAQNYVLAVMQCVGPSMLPTLGAAGDVVLMWPTASGLIKPQLGDVVICSSPTDPTSTVCKRVTGLPGDVVRYRRLPGMPSRLPGSGGSDGYASYSRDSTEVVAQVPRGQCWLQGDNAADSCDSRYYGPVPLSLVRGVVFLKLWPLGSSGAISRTQPLQRAPPHATTPTPPAAEPPRVVRPDAAVEPPDASSRPAVPRPQPPEQPPASTEPPQQPTPLPQPSAESPPAALSGDGAPQPEPASAVAPADGSGTTISASSAAGGPPPPRREDDHVSEHQAIAAAYRAALLRPSERESGRGA